MDALTCSRYILMWGSARDTTANEAAQARARSVGLHPLAENLPGGASLLVSAHTPTAGVPEGGLVIGQLFHRNGNRLLGPRDFPNLRGSAEVRHYILEQCWGDYILCQPQPDESSVLVMRDPSGAVPCIYASDEEGGFVTSDIPLATALGNYEPRLDWEYIGFSLQHTHLKTQQTGLSRLLELLPGMSLRVGRSRPVLGEEWTPWKFVAADFRHDAPVEAASDVRRAITSVTAALANIDGSALLELSGGLDSSIIGACLRGANARIVCCNLSTPVPGAVECDYASAVADTIGAKLLVRELCIEDARYSFPPPPCAVRPRVWALQYAVDAVMEASARSEQVTSHYSGAGGDSVFGYIRSAAPIADALREGGLRKGATAIRALSTVHGCTLWKAGTLAAKKLLSAPKPPSSGDHSFLRRHREAQPVEMHPWFSQPLFALPGDAERVFGLAGNQLFREGIARGARRPYRMPLLSQPVMEACLRVPSWMWFTGGQNRAVARIAFRDLLPRKVLARRSKGTFIGYSGAIYRHNRSGIRDFLLNGQLQARGMLDTDALRVLLDDESTPANKSLLRVFDLCMVENWVRHHA
ncbi:asparagine synthase-related protein [Luteimonas sp. R10]|uniref:asparagine synthase-related protein n=1 Tax=Luteimonas sp. R10 TaxID=3108176 RepID=UPI00308FD11C|nr:asparagine synthase C-terminal domain-containing protein [Luteimonas sp. R10]